MLNVNVVRYLKLKEVDRLDINPFSAKSAEKKRSGVEILVINLLKNSIMYLLSLVAEIPHLSQVSGEFW